MSIRYVASGHVVSQTVRISSPDSGVVVDLPVKLDQNVKKGQLLFQIDDEEAKQRLRSLQADIRSARTKVAENRALLSIRQRQSDTQLAQSHQDAAEAALEYQRSLAGDTLEERQKRREQLRKAQVKVAASELELSRQRQLFKEDIASQAELDAAATTYRMDQSSYREALADVRAQRKGPRPEELAKLRIRQQRAAQGVELAAQKAEEEELLVHRIQATEAEVESLETSLEQQRYLVARRRVVAPSDGAVSQINFEEGEMVTIHSHVLSLVSNASFWVEADVDEQDAVHVAVNQPVTVSLTSIPGKTFDGKVSQVAPSLEARPQGPADHKVLRIRVKFTEKVSDLRSGLEADVNGQVGVARQALSVPRAALLRDAGKDYVYVVNDGKLSRVVVELGAISGDRAEVKSGLKEGSEVVVEGGEGLAPGTAVRVQR